MAVGQAGEVMDHVQRHVEVEQEQKGGVVILLLQDMVGVVALGPARIVPHVTQIHVQVWYLSYLHIGIDYYGA